jgi:acylphosphatase
VPVPLGTAAGWNVQHGFCLGALIAIIQETLPDRRPPFPPNQWANPRPETTMVAKRVFYEGRVQGVGFRFSVKSITTGYDVVGYAKNLIDGRVEVEVQGEENEVDEFLEAILNSHLRRHITRFVIHEIPFRNGLKGFEIRH